ncbi:MAG TPA: GNVR domain-containing protein [Terriglobales bacterium]|jgi:polysaccharide chain length determinant protein (PEP-CTERM system associated)
MPEDFEEARSEGIDWQLYIGLARRHFWHFLLPFFFGWLLVWGASWFMPSMFKSGTLILVEEPTVPQEFVTSNISGDLQNRLQSITQQILSRTRLLSIIQQFNLYPKYRHSSPDDLVERMRKDIEIELVRSPDRQSLTAFNVYFSSDNPVTAQRVTSELTNLFISENLEVRQQQSENTTAFLENQLSVARDELAQQEAKVREFKGRYLGQLPGQLQTNLQIMNGLQTQLQSEEDALNRAKQQNAYLQSLLNEYHALRSSSRGTGVAVGLPAADQELDRLKAELADLSSRYTEKHPDVKKLKEQIAKTERMKSQMLAGTNGSDAAPAGTSSGDPNTAPMMQLQSQLKANEIEIADHQRTIQQLRGKIGDYQGRVSQEPVLEQQLADLTRGYEQSKQDYDSLLKKKNESSLATSLERQQQGEHFRILDPPNLPLKPDSPKRLQIFAIGLAVGMFLGVALSAILEIMDDHVYSDKALKKMLPGDVIVEIPPLSTAFEQKQEARQVHMAWASAAAVVVSVLIAFAVTFLKG